MLLQARRDNQHANSSLYYFSLVHTSWTTLNLHTVQLRLLVKSTNFVVVQGVNMGQCHVQVVVFVIAAEVGPLLSVVGCR